MVSQAINSKGYHSFVPGLISIFFRDNMGPFNSETRLRQGQNPSLLDLIFTNEENMVNNLNIFNPIGRSDHCVLTFNLVSYGL